MASFESTFLNPMAYAQSWDVGYEENDDGLGYYADGVKRTLTDAEIEFFRQSELRELRKKKQSPPLTARMGKTSTKSGKKNGKKMRREPKPDLRKRTWDVVEAGLDTLDYD